LPGAYFVTLCVQGGECLFGEIVGGAMVMNENGGVVADAWEWLASRYEHVDLDEWIVMPKHLHGILVISDRGIRVRAIRESPHRHKTLGQSAWLIQNRVHKTY
jgi:putative transposase